MHLMCVTCYSTCLAEKCLLGSVGSRSQMLTAKDKYQIWWHYLSLTCQIHCSSGSKSGLHMALAFTLVFTLALRYWAQDGKCKNRCSRNRDIAVYILHILLLSLHNKQRHPTTDRSGRQPFTNLRMMRPNLRSKNSKCLIKNSRTLRYCTC